MDCFGDDEFGVSHNGRGDTGRLRVLVQTVDFRVGGRYFHRHFLLYFTSNGTVILYHLQNLFLSSLRVKHNQKFHRGSSTIPGWVLWVKNVSLHGGRPYFTVAVKRHAVALLILLAGYARVDSNDIDYCDPGNRQTYDS